MPTYEAIIAAFDAKDKEKEFIKEYEEAFQALEQELESGGNGSPVMIYDDEDGWSWRWNGDEAALAGKTTQITIDYIEGV